jgi:hypothetical protein
VARIYGKALPDGDAAGILNETPLNFESAAEIFEEESCLPHALIIFIVFILVGKTSSTQKERVATDHRIEK